MSEEMDDDDDLSFPEGNADAELLAAQSGSRDVCIAMILSKMEDLRGSRPFFCVEFYDSAELFFASDSDAYVRDILSEKNIRDLSRATIVDEWPLYPVSRNGKRMPMKPAPEHIFVEDVRLQTATSVKQLFSMQDDYPELDEVRMENAIGMLLNAKKDPFIPTESFLLLLEDLLRAGETLAIAEKAECFVHNALKGSRKEIYRKKFPVAKIAELEKEKTARQNRAAFIELTGTPAHRITCLAELEKCVPDMDRKKRTGEQLRIATFHRYLTMADETTSHSIIEAVIFPLCFDKTKSIRAMARETLQSLGFTVENSQLTPIRGPE
jgi:hypothetical protein